MPHKRNPITCERICGMARLLRGYAQSAYEDQALWHERDISHSSVERVILPDATISLNYMLHLTIRTIDKLLVYPETMLKNLNLNRWPCIQPNNFDSPCRQRCSARRSIPLGSKICYGTLA